MIARAGSRIYKGREVPESAIIYTSQLGREFWISAVGEIKSFIIFVDDGTNIEINSLHLHKTIKTQTK